MTRRGVGISIVRTKILRRSVSEIKQNLNAYNMLTEDAFVSRQLLPGTSWSNESARGTLVLSILRKCVVGWIRKLCGKYLACMMLMESCLKVFIQKFVCWK